MLKAIVVDDEPLARDELTFLLSQCEGVDVVGEAGFAREAERLCDDVRPQVAFVDVRMPGPDGFTLTDRLRLKYPDLEVVIVSAYSESALRGFDVQVSDYLLKPVRLERLKQTLERMNDSVLERSYSPGSLERLAVRRRNSYVVVDLRTVIYFEARDGFVWAVTAKDRFSLDLTIAALAERLDRADFFQSHRRCIVQISRIRTIEPVGARAFTMLLDHPDNPRVPLARDRVGKLRERIPLLR